MYDVDVPSHRRRREFGERDQRLSVVIDSQRFVGEVRIRAPGEVAVAPVELQFPQVRPGAPVVREGVRAAFMTSDSVVTSHVPFRGGEETIRGNGCEEDSAARSRGNAAEICPPTFPAEAPHAGEGLSVLEAYAGRIKGENEPARGVDS